MACIFLHDNHIANSNYMKDYANHSLVALQELSCICKCTVAYVSRQTHMESLGKHIKILGKYIGLYMKAISMNR